ncbi:phospholipase A and acyltransferase 4 isoform X2 [Coregonus clupeaformis]|uniref:phospholipase A and acyltransferase 4 isoform X2 n=1 Tax=Coregonus clupeaformis TaxID=59861 RepID=UPI001BE07B6D|nr:phospholipase A and acyltransferase 4 isoform X2 [Coregonus clupeaformis]
MQTRSPTTMEIGDMIEIKKKMFKHWALYIGNGEVIHLINQETYEDVTAGKSCRINNYLDDKYKPRTTDVIMEEVNKMRGRTIKYDLLGDNCEHFVTFLRYGKSESKQADDFMNRLLIGSAGLVVVAPAVGVCATAAAAAAAAAVAIKHSK